MNEEELIEFLEKNLTIECLRPRAFGSGRPIIQLIIGGTVISETELESYERPYSDY